MPLKRSIAAVAIAFGVAGCGATVQTQAQLPTRPVLQAGDAKAPDAGAAKTEARKKRHGKKLSRLFDAMAAKDPSVKADLDQLKTRLMGLTKEQRRAMHAMWWEGSKNNTLDEMRLKLQGFLDTPSTFVTHLKTNLDKLQAMSATEITAMADKFPPSTFKQLRQMMRDARKADLDKAEKKEAATGKEAEAESEEDEAEDEAAGAARKPAETDQKLDADKKLDSEKKADSGKAPDAARTPIAQPATGLTTNSLFGTASSNPYQSPYSWW